MQVHVLHDLQFGSTGKGALASYLAFNEGYTAVATAWSPNAGHTFVDDHPDHGTKKVVTTQLASAAHYVGVKTLFVGAGSVINIHKLHQEVQALVDLGCRFPTAHGLDPWTVDHLDILVHAQAAIVTDAHVQAEKVLVGLGSTSKGSMEAVVSKMRRPLNGGDIARNHKQLIEREWITPGLQVEIHVVSDSEYLSDLGIHFMYPSNKMLLEGAQGFSLGLHNDFYPYVTSRECTPQQVATDCRIPAHLITREFGVCRTYPIRVANRFDDKGNQIGWSGSCYEDQRELTWDELNQNPEFTTVTGLQRRVFTFSQNQIHDALQWSKSKGVFLNFCNYLGDKKAVSDTIDLIESVGGKVQFLGFGAHRHDITTTENWDGLCAAWDDKKAE